MYSFQLEQGESILKKDLANLQTEEDDALQGALYLTNERLVYVGYILDISKKYKMEIPLAHIRAVRPAKTFFVIPNVLRIETIRDEKLKFVLSRRNEWLDEISKQINMLE